MKTSRPPCFRLVQYDWVHHVLFLLFGDKSSYVYPTPNEDMLTDWERTAEAKGTFFDLNVRRPNIQRLPYFRQHWQPDDDFVTIVDERSFFD